MNQEVRPHFLNLKHLMAQEIRDALSGTPHLLSDSFGNTVSSRDS